MNMDLHLPRPSKSYTILDELEMMRFHTVEVPRYLNKLVNYRVG